VERAIRQLDDERIQAQIGADATALDRIYADDFIGVGPSGTVRTKPQVISDFTSGDLKFESITTDEVQVRVYDNTAVETGLSTMVGQDKGRIVPRDTRFTRVWAKRKGRWRLVANHYSIRTTQQSNQREADTRELERLEKIWNEAHEHGDADALQALWSDDLEVDVPRMPVMNKSDVLNFARSGHMKFLRYATSDIRIRTYGDTAIVSGRMQRTRQINGKVLSDDWRFTKVYVRQAQQWHVVAFHASEAARP
jgi:uncharacterized protein (TIGR02246 family)